MFKRGTDGFNNPNKKINTANETRIIFGNTSNLRWGVFIFFLLVLLLLSGLFITVLSLVKDPIFPSFNKTEWDSYSDLQPVKGDYVNYSANTNQQVNEKFLKRKIANQTDVYAFYVNWDKNSKNSLKRNINKIDVLIPGWYQLGSNLELKGDVEKDIGSLAKKHNTMVIPLINNVVNGKWDQEIIHRLLHSPRAQATLIHNLQQEINKNGYDGINIDFEFNRVSDRDLLTNFMRELYQSFHKEGLLVTMDIQPTNDSFDYTKLEEYCDRMILMLYDENMENPGPISSQSWYIENLSKVPKDKLIISLGNYGYDWDWETGQAGKVVSFEDIMRMADKANLSVQWDDMSKSPYIRYEKDKRIHEIWFLDSVTFYNQWRVAVSSGVKGIALWRLGTEDPSVWNVVGGQKANTLLSVKNGDSTNNYGNGNILHPLTDQLEGSRSLDFDDSGLIKSESYLSFPKASEIERLNKPSTSKEIVLSFDDGPDPIFTKKILAILKEYHIKATFFIIGKDALLHPGIVKQIDQEGHEIGNHTFSHPNIYNVSYPQLKWELNSTERIIQAITGHSSILYRSPYGDDFNMYDGDQRTPYVKSQFQRLMDISQMGYITVNYDVDSSDWKLNNKQDIVENVVKQAANGDIILLHDGGGDRTATVQALPGIIEQLKHQGYKFVTVSDMINRNEESISPKTSKKERSYIQYLSLVLETIAVLKNVLVKLFYGALLVFILRLSLFIFLAWRHKKRSLLKTYKEGYNPLVSVVIAAYNEEKVIKRTIQSVLDSTYVNLEVLVIDDGSKDQTSVVMSENFSNHPKVRRYFKRNGGKSSAINIGIKKAEGKIIVAIDADTMIAPKAIALLVRHFADDKVAAVSGNVKVGNRRNLITTWQHIEYVTGFNLEKRAHALLNCVTVVPGAIGAWRKQIVENLGNFTNDTLAEDTDLTLRILSAGYKVAIEDQAYAYTEAPENIRGFLKQRFRWNYGTLQCLWKHKNAFWKNNNKSLSFIALPNILLFQFLVPVFAPILDILMVIGLVTGNLKYFTILYTGYFIVDFVVCLFALRWEKSKLTPLFSLFFQRIFYRYMLLWVSWKSIFKAIQGGRVGWGKLERTGNIEVVKKVG
ncbi:glycosyltransferase [Neobacillus drentensis]|uniref:glycosyltransferase n=1 Tax=Neobacillus drentensis TaxID=220684 RepID=UPI001F20D44C|nr:glycosyltransferase [Neobacillus drentensis]ULT56684.1 glycosyltransferase [Neobacillus drentensis]